MKRTAMRLLWLGAALSPTSLYALGLGDIRLNSALNQPLDADIELVSATPDELASLKVAIAGDDAFKRFGLDRPDFFSSISLRVEGAGSANPVIRLRSSSAITEPFVSLVIEASWSSGRVVREYTMLLDPPVFAPGQTGAAAAVVTPQGRTTTAPATSTGTVERAPAPTAPAAPAPAPAPAAAAQPAPAPTQSTPANPTPAAVSGSTYQVRPADTLFRIASGVRPGSSRSAVNQTMIALYRANPTAFEGNINLLRAGSVLRIPPTAEIDAISTSEAASEVARQYGAWRANPTAAAATPPAGEDQAARLRLVTPEGAASSSAGTNTAAQNQQVQALNQRVQTLEAELAETKRLLDLRNSELARLQQSQGAATPQAPAATTPAPNATPPAAEAPAPAQTAPAEEAPPAEQKPAQRPAATPAPAAEPGLLERLSDYWLYAVAAGIVLILALLFYIRRRREEADAEASIETLTPTDFAPRTLPAAPKPRTPPETFEVSEQEDLDHTVAATTPAFAPEEDIMTRHDAPPEPAAVKLTDDTLSSETAIQLDQQDALAEADFHMAYGLYDQAADLVKIAVQRQPERRDLKLKLLEIYFVWGNKDLFLETARDLHSTLDEAAPGEWDKVVIMGKQIASDDPLFAAAIAGTHAAENPDVNLEGGENRVDIDLYEAPEGEYAKGDTASMRSMDATKGSESDLDFLLDEPVRGVDSEPTQEMEKMARTQETPTIESPYIPDRSAQTIREKVDARLAGMRDNIDQTAELSLDEIGLDIDSLDVTGSPLEETGRVLEDTGRVLEDTGRVLEDTGRVGDRTEVERALSDDELTRIAPHTERDENKTMTMLAPHMDHTEELGEEDPGGTLQVERIELEGGDTVEQRRPRDADSTAIFQPPENIDIDMDLDRLAEGYPGEEGDTVKHQGRAPAAEDRFSEDVFGEETRNAGVDLDVGAMDQHGEIDQTEAVATALELPEIEPVTMSEVGTKLDLARAYMDMGDPDGARSILEEVLQEGTPSQKQEAQRLLDSIR